MCEALRELMAEEFEAERGKARLEGRTEMVTTVVSNLLGMNMSIEDIVKATGESEETIHNIIVGLGKCSLVLGDIKEQIRP